MRLDLPAPAPPEWSPWQFQSLIWECGRPCFDHNIYPICAHADDGDGGDEDGDGDGDDGGEDRGASDDDGDNDHAEHN